MKIFYPVLFIILLVFYSTSIWSKPTFRLSRSQRRMRPKFQIIMPELPSFVKKDIKPLGSNELFEQFKTGWDN